MLAKNIISMRKQRGMTQEELASRLHVVRQTVSKWEKGLSVPDADLLKRLAEVLETDISTLLGKPINAESNTNGIAEQLSRINENLASKIRMFRRIWVVIGIVALSSVILTVMWIILGQTTGINENTSIVQESEIVET